jgi:hypothetical protein
MKELLKKTYIWSIASLLLVGVLTHMRIPYFFYFYLLVIGFFLAYYILKETKFNRISLLLLSSFLWSTCLLVSFIGLVALLSVPISLWMLWIPLFFLSLLIFLNPPEFKKIRMEFEIVDILLLMLGVLSITSRVVSVRGFLVPILHDPIAHAVWAKQIYDTGLINYFYSPGLHILSALGMMVDGVNVSKYVLLLTNIFNALSFVPVYLFVKSYFKDKKFALLSAAIFIIAIFPAKFFWAAGKNGLVMAIPIMFLALFIASLELKSLRKFIILNFLIFAIILTHYPAAFIALIGVFFVLLYKEGLKGLLNIAVGCGLGLVWGLIKVQYQVTHMEESVSTFSGGTPLTFQNIVTFGESTYFQVRNFFNFPLGNALFLFGLLGLITMTAISLKKKGYLYFMLFFYVNILFTGIISFSGKLSFLRIVASTQHLMLFVFVYIGTAFLFAKIILPYLLKIEKRFLCLFYLLVIVLAFYSSYKIYTTYSNKQESLNLVQEDDLAVFEWMSENIDGDVVVLNNANVGNRKSIVFASDGGAWIPVFTDFEIAMPFTEFSSRNTHDNYEIYYKISKGEFSCEDIDILLDKDITYYYRGSKGVFGGEIIPEVEDPNFDVVFSVGHSVLYEIVPCK